MKIKNTEIKIIQYEITKLLVEAVVHDASRDLLIVQGLGDIKDNPKEIPPKPGEQVFAPRPVIIGEAILSPKGPIKAKYIIQAATLNDKGIADETKIRQSCASALYCADHLRIRSVAFPALGCGKGQFPLVGAAKIIAQEILKFVRKTTTSLTEIIICLPDDKTFLVFDQTIRGYLKHILDPLTRPHVTVDVIIEYKDGIILIERSNPPYGWALPGGFVDYGESFEDAARRETREETNLDLEELKQFHTYSDPTRDERFHTVSTVFTAQGKGNPKAGDDAKALKIIKHKDLRKFEYAFDHRMIIEDYLRSRDRKV